MKNIIHKITDQNPPQFPCEMCSKKLDGAPHETWHEIPSAQFASECESLGVEWHSWRTLPDAPAAPTERPDTLAKGGEANAPTDRQGVPDRLKGDVEPPISSDPTSAATPTAPAAPTERPASRNIEQVCGVPPGSFAKHIEAQIAAGGPESHAMQQPDWPNDNGRVVDAAGNAIESQLTPDAGATPRTDAELSDWPVSDAVHVQSNWRAKVRKFARTLERELAAKDAEIARLKEQVAQTLIQRDDAGRALVERDNFRHEEYLAIQSAHAAAQAKLDNTINELTELDSDNCEIIRALTNDNTELRAKLAQVERERDEANKHVKELFTLTESLGFKFSSEPPVEIIKRQLTAARECVEALEDVPLDVLQNTGYVGRATNIDQALTRAREAGITGE